MSSTLNLEHFTASLDRMTERHALASASLHPTTSSNSPADADDVDNRWRSLLDALAAAVYLTDASGKLIYFNRAAADLWGQSPTLGTAQWCGSWRLLWPDGRPMAHDECPMAVALKEGRAIRDSEAISERPDGTRVPFLAYPCPLWNDDGELIGGINMLIDISSRKRTERADHLLAAIVESSADAIVSKDLNGIVATWNSGAQRLFGYSADEIVGQPVSILIPPDRADEEPSIIERIKKGERVETYETVRRRKDGTLVDVALTISPVRSSDGRIVGASKIARDITERRRAAEHQKLLVGEIKHRIKNSLATVQAIARQTLTSASHDEIDAFVGRLQALAGAHDVLTTENWNRAPLEQVVARAIGVFDDIDNERFVIDGRSYVWIDADRSSRLAMVLHELATNAIKYGALSNATGQVMISWDTHSMEEGRQLQLFWQEVGGPQVSKPERAGFGSSMIQRALQGESSKVTVDYDPAGLRVQFDLPV